MEVFFAPCFWDLEFLPMVIGVGFPFVGISSDEEKQFIADIAMPFA